MILKKVSGKIPEKNLEKFKELLIYVVHKFGDNRTLTETKLWKLLYFCEADYFEKYRTTITKINYYKNNFGPTPDTKIITIIKPQVAKSYIEIEKKKRTDGSVISIYKPHQAYDSYKELSANEIVEINRTCEKYANLSTIDICILAHKDPPYLGATKGEKINFQFVDYREDDIEDVEKEQNAKSFPSEVTISDEAAERFLEYVGINV